MCVRVHTYMSVCVPHPTALFSCHPEDLADVRLHTVALEVRLVIWRITFPSSFSWICSLYLFGLASGSSFWSPELGKQVICPTLSSQFLDLVPLERDQESVPPKNTSFSEQLVVEGLSLSRLKVIDHTDVVYLAPSILLSLSTRLM